MTETHKLEYADFAALSAELIENSGGLRFRARGNSMRPAILDGDVVTIEKTSADKIRTGDIVMISNDSTILVHRVIKCDKNTWTTCGDALLMHDEPFSASQLIGRVTNIEHNNVIRKCNPIRGRMTAAISRHSNTMPARLIKKCLAFTAR